MKTLLRVLACLVAAVFAILFVGYTTIYAFAFGFSKGCAEGESYKKPFRDAGFYERFPSLLAAQFGFLQARNDSGRTDADPATGLARRVNGLAAKIPRNLTSNDVVILANTLMPAPWLRERTEQFIDEVMRFTVRRTGEDQEVVVDFSDIKARLKGGVGLRTAMEILQSRPEKADWQRPDGSLPLMSQVDLLLAARPPRQQLDELAPMIRSQLSDLADMLPEKQVLGQGAIKLTPEEEEFWAYLKGFLDWGWLASLAFLLFVIGFGVRSWKGLALWTGFPLLVVGLALLSLSGGGVIEAIGRYLAQVLNSPGGEEMRAFKECTAPAMWDSMLAIVNGMAVNLLSTVRSIGWAVAIVGVVALLAGSVSGKKVPGEEP